MRKLFCSIAFFVFLTFTTLAQDLENPGNYMTYIGKAEEVIGAKYMSYMSGASHGKSLRKVEKRRQELLNSIYEMRVRVNDMPSYKGDKSLRDASVNYLKLMYSIFNEDYSRIVNMEEIAEQSYDNMEAYMLVKEKASEKLREAAAGRTAVWDQFAKKYNVTVLDNTSQLEQKLDKADKVNNYYNDIYLVFFKPYKQEMYLIAAVDSKNVNAIEQNRNSLLKFATEGLDKLKEIGPFEGDPSLMVACRQVLQFMKDEATDKLAPITDFIMKAENFEQVKKAFNAIPASKRTQQDINNYNKAVNEMNKGIDHFNRTNKMLNDNRNSVMKGWDNSVQSFLDQHMPYR
ncbi:MAG TPA: hypothetical protein VGD17_03135 [Chitinophagaceae bacterium]